MGDAVADMLKPGVSVGVGVTQQSPYSGLQFDVHVVLSWKHQPESAAQQ